MGTQERVQLNHRAAQTKLVSEASHLLATYLQEGILRWCNLQWKINYRLQIANVYIVTPSLLVHTNTYYV